MCGRVRCTLRPDDVSRACHLNSRPVRHLDVNRYSPSHNVAPGWNLSVVRREDGPDDQGAVLHCMKWGLIPSFTKKTEKPDHFKMFNARSESIGEKASFRRLIPKNRCLVAVEGFYEWKKDGYKKQPYYIHFKDGRPLVFAALFDSWKNSEGEILYTFTILTTSSSSALEWLHDRMPIILGDKGSTDAWLNGPPSSKFDIVLKPYEEPDLAWYPVTPAMGKLSFDGPECIKEIELKIEETKPISKFFSKKEIKSGQDNSQIGSMHKEPSNADQQNILKEEPGTQDGTHYHSFSEKGNGDLKLDVSALPAGVATDVHLKRGYEEFSADTEPSVDKTDKPSPSPARKKGNIKGADDKQPTLFSYFGKG